MKIAFYSTKPYDRMWFEPLGKQYGYEIHFIEFPCTRETLFMAKGCDAICIFVNDHVDSEMIEVLYDMHVKGILLRSAGFNNVDVKAAENVPEGRILGDYSFGENAWKYLDKMTALCEEKVIELLLIKAPSLYPYWYPEWEAQVEEYAAAHNLRYINFLELQEDTGIDYSTDTYDGGLHMNLSGAEKLSRYLGKMLTEELKVPDRRDEAHLSALWEEKIAAYEAEKEEQYRYYGMK